MYVLCIGPSSVIGSVNIIASLRLGPPEYTTCGGGMPGVGRSSFVHSLLLDLNSYGGNDPDEIFPLLQTDGSGVGT